MEYILQSQGFSDLSSIAYMQILVSSSLCRASFGLQNDPRNLKSKDHNFVQSIAELLSLFGYSGLKTKDIHLFATLRQRLHTSDLASFNRVVCAWNGIITGIVTKEPQFEKNNPLVKKLQELASLHRQGLGMQAELTGSPLG